MHVQLRDWVLGLFCSGQRTVDTVARTRGAAIHVIILDGTMSSLDKGRETNAGLTFRLLQEAGRRANLTVYYEAGIQWRDWSGTWGVITGKGINHQIERAYGVLASRYKIGDRIILIGYSRGAYAVRSLAGIIDYVGLVKAEHAMVRTVRQAYRHYKMGAKSDMTNRFRDQFCHANVHIEAVAVWDTVKALGLRLPIVWRWAQAQHDYHNHKLGNHVRNGFQALAIDETRKAYAPVMWDEPPDWDGHIEQVWFRGTHGDVGGQLAGHLAARPLANIPLVWMLTRLETCGIDLPNGWQDRFPQDPNAPSIGAWRGWSKMFLSRRSRIMLAGPSESIHPSGLRD